MAIKLGMEAALKYKVGGQGGAGEDAAADALVLDRGAGDRQQPGGAGAGDFSLPGFAGTVEGSSGCCAD